MKLGILETDHLNHDLLGLFGSYGEQFTKLLHQVDPQLAIECFDVVALNYPQNIDQCDAYLITGSKFAAYDQVPWILTLQDYIRKLNNHKKPLIGICFGHQLIAHSLGGLTQKSKKGWGVGLSRVKVRKQQEWMIDFQNQFSLLVSHQDQVVKLPDKAEIIASNDFCMYAALQIDKHILTFQGHPEFSKTYLKALMHKRKDSIGEITFNRAVSSLKNGTNSILIVRWILKFLTSNLKI